MTAWPRFVARVTLSVLLTTVVACSSSDEPAATSAPAPAPASCEEGSPGCVGWVSCPPEITEKEEASVGPSCREIVPPNDCAPGTMASLGSRECVPVGPAKCENGFEKDPSGWGCRAVLPEKTCAGATRDALGSASCVPVGDCDAPFPPANATLFVNAAFTDADVGPTKFKTIKAALAAATSSSVIAVESGTYVEGIESPTSSLTIVGRCADKVHIDGTTTENHGLYLGKRLQVTLKGVTLIGHYEGVRAMGGAKITLEDVVIEGPRFTGLITYQPDSLIHAERVVVRNTKPHEPQNAAVVSVNADEGGTIELVDSAIANSWEAGVVATNASSPKTPSKVVLTRSVVRGTNLDQHGNDGAGVVISGYSSGEITDSAILDSRRDGIMTVYEGPQVTMTRGEIRRTLDDKATDISSAIYSESGKVTLEDVSIHDATQSGLMARTKGSITGKGVVVHGTKPGADGAFGMGAWADSGGKITLEKSALVDNAYYGAAVLYASSVVTLKDTLIRGTAAQKIDQGGLGRGVNVEDGAAANLDNVSIIANDGEGLFVRGETKEGKRAHATANRLLIANARTFDGTGLFVAKGGLVEIEGGAIIEAQKAGVVVNETVGDKGSHSEATLTHVIIRGTKRGERRASDKKNLVLDGIGIGNVGLLTLRSSAVIGNTEFGVIVGSPEDGPSTTTIENTFLGSTLPNDDGSFGHGLVAFTRSNVIIKNTEISKSNIGLVFDGANAIVTSSRVRGNAVGIQVQHDSTLAAGATAPESPDPGVVFVSDDSEFIENATRVGSGDVPLPTNPFGDITPTSK